MTLRAGLYVRVSTDDQADQGYSLEAQLGAGRERAAREGWELQEYIEPGQSAKTEDRPVYQRLLADAAAGHLDIIIVHKLDRLSRSVLDVLTVFQRMEQWQVQFVSLTEPFDFTTPVGRVVLTIMASFSQWFLDNLSQETKKGMRQKVLEGGHPWRAPLGYVNRQDNGRAYVDSCPTLGPLVSRGFQEIAAGVTLSEWSETAFREGYRSRAGYRISQSVWQRTFRNRFYLGYAYYKSEGIEVPGNHPALTDQSTFERVQSVIGQRAHAERGYTWHNNYLLHGLLWSIEGECPFWCQTAGVRRIAYYRTRRPVAGQVVYVPCTTLDDQVPGLLSETCLSAAGGLALPESQRHLTLALKVAPHVSAVYMQLDSFADRRALIETVFSRIAVSGDTLVSAGTVLKEPFAWVRVFLAPAVGLGNPDRNLIVTLNGLLVNGTPVPSEAVSFFGGVS